jgi:hypothetical protein
LPSGEIGAVPATNTWFPIRRARQKPNRASKGDPLTTRCTSVTLSR